MDLYGGDQPLMCIEGSMRKCTVRTGRDCFYNPVGRSRGTNAEFDSAAVARFTARM